MTTTTNKLGLKVWTSGDAFHVQDFTDNFNALDLKPGIHVCTSTTRPTTWGANQSGMFIFETDTTLVWRWDGAAFVRQWGKGWLGSTERTTPFTTTATAPQTVATVSVTVPAGARQLLVVIEGGALYNTNGSSQVNILRDGATSLQSFNVPWGGAGSAGPIALTTLDSPGAGTHAYALQVGAVLGVAGTTTLTASPSQPASIHVIEV